MAISLLDVGGNRATGMRLRHDRHLAAWALRLPFFFSHNRQCAKRLTAMRERKRTVDLRPTNCFASVLLHTWFIPTERESIDTQPGSLARVLVFCQRLERGEQLFHPADRRCFGAGDEA